MILDKWLKNEQASQNKDFVETDIVYKHDPLRLIYTLEVTSLKIL